MSIPARMIAAVPGQVIDPGCEQLGPDGLGVHVAGQAQERRGGELVPGEHDVTVRSSYLLVKFIDDLLIRHGRARRLATATSRSRRGRATVVRNSSR